MNYYDKINWKNRSEGKTTKISAERLNHMDNQIFNNANAIGNVEKIADIGDGTLCGAAETLKETAEKLTQSLKLLQSHVGMIVQSTTLDTEAKVIAIYGGTKWTKIEGRFLLGASSAYKVNTTGGEASHTLTINEMPSHNHTTYCGGTQNFAVQPVVTGAAGWNAVNALSSSSGGGQAHNNMPPYKVVYIWERTA